MCNLTLPISSRGSNGLIIYLQSFANKRENNDTVPTNFICSPHGNINRLQTGITCLIRKSNLIKKFSISVCNVYWLPIQVI